MELLITYIDFGGKMLNCKLICFCLPLNNCKVPKPGDNCNHFEIIFVTRYELVLSVATIACHLKVEFTAQLIN